MLRENLTGGSENPPLTALTERQVDVLRLLGKGNSPRGVSRKFADQNSGVDVGNELRKIYATLGVSGRTAAVVFALDNGFFKTSELVEKDFDWSLFNDLKPIQISILEEFTRAKDETLTEEELSRLNIATSQDPKDYVSHSIVAMCDKLGLKNKTEAIVYYYAFRERQQEQGDIKVPAAKEILTNREIQVLEWLVKGLLPSVIAKNRWAEPVGTQAIYDHKRKILAKLGVTNIEAATKKARELGILKS